MKRVEWTEARVERLVDQLEKYECLWHVKTKDYHDRNLLQKALNEIVLFVQYREHRWIPKYAIQVSR